MRAAETDEAERGPGDSVRLLGRVWLGMGVGSLAVAMLLTYDPSFADAASGVVTVLPFVVLVAMIAAFTELDLGLGGQVRFAAIAITIAGWTVLMSDDDRWSILTFALYALCFSSGRLVGIGLAALVSAVWCLVWMLDDAPTWRVLVPLAVFGVGAATSLTIYGVDRENTEQAELIERLREAQRDLASSEREKGVLEERARFAGEIHDTLAQGFTSIVLVSRATRRNGDWDDGLAAIEATAQEHLQAARRLVAASGPVELESASLPDALERQVGASLGGDIDSTFSVDGSPRPLSGAVEVALLRAAQEALLNVRTHAQASEVHLTLSYFDSSVALDVQDDGVGFVEGVVTDRGALTGGQGLRTLASRVESLGGALSVEARQGGGTVVSVQLPAVSA